MYLHSRIINVFGEVIDAQPPRELKMGEVWGYGPILIGFQTAQPVEENGQPVAKETGYYISRIEAMVTETETLGNGPRIIVPKIGFDPKQG